MTRYLLIAGLVLSGLLRPSSSVAAQSERTPSTQECEAAAVALSQGARDGSGWERLVDCGAIAGRALANAIRAARSETDVDYLGRLYSAVARVRHHAVFSSTLDVMGDPAASVPARATAILMAMSHHEPGWALPPSFPYRQAVTSSAGERCQLVRLNRLYRSSAPLPADYLQQLGNTIEQLAGSPRTPALVRAFAGCALRVVRRDLGVDVSKLGLTYLCGDRFRATNQSGEWIQVSWEVSGTRDRGDLMIPPMGETIFATERQGDTRLSYGGKPVKTESNAGKSCSSSFGDSATVAAVVELYHRALVAGDSVAALGQLAEDAVIMESGSVESRKEYRSHHLPADIAFARATKGTRSPLRVSVRGDVAWTTATSTTRGRFQGKSVRSAGAELMVLTRGKDGWKISAIHWSSRDRP